MPEILVGTLVKLLVPCLGNPAGTIGVCYDVYDIFTNVMKLSNDFELGVFNSALKV